MFIVSSRELGRSSLNYEKNAVFLRNVENSDKSIGNGGSYV